MAMANVATPEAKKLQTSSDLTGSTATPSPGSARSSPVGDAGAVRRLFLDEAGLEAGEGPALGQTLLAGSPEEQRVYWEAFFVVMPFFCGYACLFGLQHCIKSKFGIQDNSSSASHQFGVAVSFLYIFNLIFRVAHNILFGCFSPRARVYIATGSMMLSMLVIGVVIMTLESYHIAWVVIAYALGGVAVGSFESNLLCCLTPFGHRTKHVAIMGIPVGVTSVLVGAFFLMGPPLQLPPTHIYFGVAFMLFLGMLVFTFRIPNGVPVAPGVEVKGQIGLKKFAADFRQFKKWLPQLWHYPLAFTVDMFTLSCFSPGVALYIYDQKTVQVLPFLTLQTDTFFAMYNMTNMLGGLLGRGLSYKLKPRHPLVYVCFNLLGVAMILSRIPILAPLSTFLIMLGDGLIYGTISRHIDTVVPKEFNLTAISYWLFIGDIGSVTGSNLISYIRDWVVGN